ncbi:hypothetical protein C943_03744 [Mariniradius saccharolyticus AK6]|uniref:Uncharacterized protein n=2 Tax=Mariniradius TaxID=1245590 RepID=M7XAS1_9BACT|nr:hypothetical protein C943_03744 [Mariniradius saccharolyticus AK6]
MDDLTQDLETLAFEGISIDFKFNSDKPTFGDLFLIVGYENPNFPPNSREFKSLQNLGFEQVDDYFGIRNTDDIGDDVKIWMYPIINGEEVYHNEGPFDAIRLNYVIVRNDKETEVLFEKAFNSIATNLNVTPTFNGQPIDSYDNIKKTINDAIQYCKQELKVEPGSDEALQLDW